MSILSKHVHTNADPHRLTALDDRRVRCHDCAHTIELSVPSGVGTTSPTSQQKCPTHPASWALNCGGCRADQLAVRDEWDRS